MIARIATLMLAFATVLCSMPSTVFAATRTLLITGELKVFDGDTLEVGPLVIRLHGKIISCICGYAGTAAF